MSIFNVYYRILFLSTALLTVITGCATITGSGSAQSLSFQTYKIDGTDLDGARCEMTNDEGTWFVVTPGTVTVQRSNKDLSVTHKREYVWKYFAWRWNRSNR